MNCWSGSEDYNLQWWLSYKKKCDPFVRFKDWKSFINVVKGDICPLPPKREICPWPPPFRAVWGSPSSTLKYNLCIFLNVITVVSTKLKDTWFSNNLISFLLSKTWNNITLKISIFYSKNSWISRRLFFVGTYWRV